ncbi:MAG: cytochrome c biogenesis protein CcdA [FCB group bacterium]|jgi:thiol:disulfide interchange protein|nr:cytochrome c biogenesis protein CcdA [FCB group bacterium]
MNLARLVAGIVALVAMAFGPVATAQGQGGPEIALEPLSAASAFHPGETAKLGVHVKLSEGWHMNAHKPLDPYLIPTVLSLNNTEGIAVDRIAYPEAEIQTFAFSPAPMAVYQGNYVIGVQARLGEALDPGEYSLKGTLKWQACNDEACWRPLTSEVSIPVTIVAAGEVTQPQHSEIFAAMTFDAAEEVTPTAPVAPATEPTEAKSGADEGAWQELADDFTIAGKASGYMNAEDFIGWVSDVQAGKSASELGMFEGRSLWMIILLTLIGGLALNLTPCVLPLIPINLAIIGAGTRAGSKTRGFALGGFYGLGIALVYGALGLVVVLGTGTFGTINSSPWFNLIIAAIFVVLGLAMFDLFAIDFSRYQGKLNLAEKRSGFLLAFTMGCIIALLAGACVAPVVIAVVLLSRDLYAGGSVVAGLSLPFVLGIGMALPWPFAGAGLSFLPKPGKWMVRVKYVFGVVILAFAAYYGWQAFTLFRDRYFVDKQAVMQSTQSLDSEGWTSSLVEGLARAKAENKPVIVDFWATWCKSCLTMNETTFQDANVKVKLDGFVKVKYQAEFPGESPAREVLERFDVVGGLPSYRILQPTSK